VQCNESIEFGIIFSLSREHRLYHANVLHSGLARQRPHPFPLHKKWEATRNYSEADLFRALVSLADLETKTPKFQRLCGQMA
jgi:hypothetical protein